MLQDNTKFEKEDGSFDSFIFPTLRDEERNGFDFMATFPERLVGFKELKTVIIEMPHVERFSQATWDLSNKERSK